MAAITLSAKGENYFALYVSGLSGTYAYKRTYLWYISTSGSYKPNSWSASGTDSAGYATQSPVATLSGLSADTYYYVWCDILLQGESTATTTLEWSGYTSVAAQTATVTVYNYLDGDPTLLNGSYEGKVGNTMTLTLSGTQYQTYSQTYDFQYFTMSSESYGAQHVLATYPIPIQTGQIVRAYYTTKITAVSPVISSISTTKDTATVTWSKNGGSYGSWTLYWGTSAGTATGSASIASSPVTVSGLSNGTTYYFWIVNTAGSSTATSTTVSASTRAQIAYFYWTSDDATYIAAGKAVTYLTAAAWNRLTAKINEVRTARGYSSLSFTSAYSGRTITAAIYNEAANAIANLTGAGSVSTVSSGTKLLATYFAGSTTALKEALNRAISSYNG